MNRAEISSCLQGSLDALSGGFLFYYREALGPNEQTPFGEKLDPEAEGIFHELLREDEKHVSDVLDAIASQHPHIVQKFGGHAMAAGLSLPVNDVDTFTQTRAAFSVRDPLIRKFFATVAKTDAKIEASIR